MRRADLDVATSRGDAVVELLERAEIAPLPVFYGLIYDYLAGVTSLDSVRAGAVVEGSTPGDGAERRLYDEFVRPYEPSETLSQVMAKLVSRLAALDELLVERCEVAREHSQVLGAASSRMELARSDPKLMRDWVVSLIAANETTRLANARLTAAVEQARSELSETSGELARLSRDSLVDPLTSIANRKGLDTELSRAIGEARDLGKCLSVGVVDVDRFKHFNDAYGHQVGDAVLKLTSRALVANTRMGDVVGRMGGDEFIVVFSDCSRNAVIDRAETIRSAVLDADLAPLLGADILGGVTISIGVASYRPGDSISTLLERADRCLLEAKARGRNQVVGEQDLETPARAATG